MPSTVADSLSSSAAESRNVHISVVHVPLNAAGMNASTTGPFFNSSLSVTGSRSWFMQGEIRRLGAHVNGHSQSPSRGMPRSLFW